MLSRAGSGKVGNNEGLRRRPETDGGAEPQSGGRRCLRPVRWKTRRCGARRLVIFEGVGQICPRRVPASLQQREVNDHHRQPLGPSLPQKAVGKCRAEMSRRQVGQCRQVVGHRRWGWKGESGKNHQQKAQSPRGQSPDAGSLLLLLPRT